MSTYYEKFRCPLCIFFFLGVFWNYQAYAQEGNEQEQDSVKTGYTFSEMSLPNPESIISQYEYDPTTDRYIYKQKLGEFNITYPLILTPEQFRDLVRKEDMKAYFKEKIDALDGKKEGSEEKQKNLLPNFYVNSNFFETVFGGREIELIPQGSVEVDLGVLYTKQDNPAFSPRNRSNFTFDFDQRISLSLLGKIGTRLQVNVNYDTESTFNFQNQVKLEYTPTEDDIIQSIEVGNVNMPLNSALIQGAQSLFGVKTQLQFGKTTITGVFSEQQSESRSVNIEGGGTVEEFEIFSSEYDENRHFFLSHYFRDTYDQSLANYPFINSNVQITRIQVWVTNRSNSAQTLGDTRNVIGIQDLGESSPENIGLFLNGEGQINPAGPIPNFLGAAPGAFPSNANNRLNPLGINGSGSTVLTPAIRDMATVDRGFGALNNQMREGVDYVRLENARQLTQDEYTLNPQLGYISLNQQLNNDEVLAVAFQFTVNDRVFQVGEFANDGVAATSGENVTPGQVPPDPANPNPNPGQNPIDNNIAVSQNLVVKMLKSTLVNVREPAWDLMMKNIYNLGVFRLEREDFRLNLLYTDPSPVNFISAVENTPLPEDVEETILLKVFNLDRLNINNDPVVGGDGFFDYVPGLTVDPENGRVIFTTVEPFGSHLFQKLQREAAEDYDNPATYNPNQNAYVFRELYRTTKIQAQQEQQAKDKFQLKGRYKSSGQDGISIGAFNVPRGSVTVTAGGRVLQEGVDYTVNYQLGRVQILDEALLASNTPIEVSTENNAVFGQQTKRFTGLNIEHKFNENFLIGGTLINLNERPLTQKSNLNFEPINNTIFGLNGNYATEVPFLTRMVNKLPNIDTDAPSNISVRGEVAYLIPGSPKVADLGGRVTSYIDDFEGAQTSIDVSSPLSWELASPPLDFGGEITNNMLASGYRRARLSWYTIDPIFYGRQQPDGISNEDVSDYRTRRVFIDEIFPQRDIATGQPEIIPTFDLHYEPNLRGPYNFNPQATGATKETLPNPEQNFGGIIRALTSTNFEQSNVEFIEFWVMDPFIYEGNDADGGKIVFNLGNINEDVLKDGRKQYENGLPPEGGTVGTVNSNFGKVPGNQSLIYAFDTEEGQRANQDLGFDGLNDTEEQARFEGFGPDPALDNYQFYLATDGSIIDRYRNYNNSQGNSPVDVTNTNRGNGAVPTVEDVNRDNTMNTIDSYYEYEIDFVPNMQPNTEQSPYLAQVIERTAAESQLELPNGERIPTRWLQFKVPIYEPDRARNISDFRSIRFLRMFLTQFDRPVTMRFATLDLVRGDYRRYTTQNANGINVNPSDNQNFIVSTVSREETSTYTIPPLVQREALQVNNRQIREDEQSLDLIVNDLAPDDARAVFKNFNIDMRQYKNLEMFLHAERVNNQTLNDNEVAAVIRMGNDFTDNFYQIEFPLQVSPSTFTSREPNPEVVWPEGNRLDLPLELLQQIKSSVINSPELRNQLVYFNADGTQIGAFDNTATQFPDGEGLKVAIKGNPSLGNVRVLMLGVKNNTTNDVTRSARVWFNEMRLSELKNRGGWAAVANSDINIADFATLSATGRKTTIGFGGIEQTPNERSREDSEQYDLVTNVNVGQLLPKKWGVQIPVNYSRGEQLITPQFDPLNQDLELETVLNNAPNETERERIENRSTDYTKRESISVIGLRKERTGESKPMPYDVENFTFSGTYNETYHRDFEIEQSIDQGVNLGATYNYGFQPWEISPFKKVKFLDKSKYFDLLQDLNFNPLPTSLTVNSNINRQYNEQVFRDASASSNFIPLDPFFQRNYLFDWQYTINHTISKSLNYSFTTTNNRIVRNYIDENNVQDNSVGVWDDFFNVGQANIHSQSLQVNYELPFSKVPFLKFVKSTYSYTGDFQWQKGSEALKTLDNIPDLGNTIQNANVHRLNNSLEFNTLYKYLGLVKKTSDKKRVKKKKKKAGDSLQANQPKIAARTTRERKVDPKKLSTKTKTYNTLIGALTMLDRVNINYQEDNGIFLPGYTRDIGFVGTLKPTAGFTFGSQEEVRDIAARNGWLTFFQDFNQRYQEVEGRQLDLQATLNIIPDLKVDISANRNYTETYTENYQVRRASDDRGIIDADGPFTYNSLSPNTFGNFTISALPIRTAFSTSGEDFSETFEEFKSNRIVVARRLAAQDPNSQGVSENGFPEGYGPNNQAVLLPAFLAAYTGADASSVKTSPFRDIPLPNWDIKYTGLMKNKWFAKKFKRFSIAHGYRSTYTLNQFQTNLEFERSNPTLTDQAGNFRNPLLYSSVNLIEQFSPLVRLDMETKGSIKVSGEVKRDRALSFSFDNNLLTEVQGNEYIFGLGYRIRDLTFVSSMGGKRRVIKSDLNFKADLSLRQNETIIRYLDIDNSQVTAGQDIYSIRFTADYALSKNLTTRFFYDHTFSEFSISTAFPQTTIRTGLTLQYNFGN